MTCRRLSVSVLDSTNWYGHFFSTVGSLLAGVVPVSVVNVLVPTDGLLVPVDGLLVPPHAGSSPAQTIATAPRAIRWWRTITPPLLGRLYGSRRPSSSAASRPPRTTACASIFSPRLRRLKRPF